MKKLVSFLFLFFTIVTFSQKEANIWYFGENAGLDFNTNPPTALTDGKINTLEGCSSFSDAAGNLLFYSDGISVFDKNNQLMTYTDGELANNLRGDPSSTQSGMIIPKPDSPNIYYLFTVDDGPRFDDFGNITENGKGFNYYTIDISLNSGKGQLIDEDRDGFFFTNLSSGLENNWTEKVAAVRGKECDTFWVISAVNSSFHAFKVDISGVNNIPIISTVTNLSERRGYLKFSPDGTKLAIANQGSNALVYNFNNETGRVGNTGASLITNSNSDGQPYGVEFSVDSSKLYISTVSAFRATLSDPPTTYKLFQFNFEATNIIGSKKIIHIQEAGSTNFPQGGFRGALQLGPDSKIYATIPLAYQDPNTLANPNGDAPFLDVIENPNADADDVIFTKNAIDLKGRFATQGLPPFISSVFFPVNIVDSNDTSVILSDKKQQVCIGDFLKIQPELTTFTSPTFKWTKEGDSSILITTPSIIIDNENFGTGVYKLEITDEGSCGDTEIYTSSIDIEFTPTPTINTIPVYEQCDFDGNRDDFITNFKLSTRESELYIETENIEIEFFELTDVTFSSPLDKDDYTNSIATSASNGNHILTVRITNTETLCFETAQIELKVSPSGIDIYPNIYTCELDIDTTNINSEGSGNAFFDFDIKTNEIILNSEGGLQTATHNFNYYRTEDDARLQNNEILAPFEDHLFIDNSDVFVRISLKGTNACESIGQFKIFIQELPIPNGNLDELILCVNNPKDTPQLITTDLDGSTGNIDDTYQWFFNDIPIIGETSSIHKASKEGIYKVEAYRNYTNDLSNTADDFSCSGYNSFTVLISNKALIESISFIDDQTNPLENLINIKIAGKGNYEFALNSTNSTDFEKGAENLAFTFTNVQPGINTVYIRDINDCGITISKEISFVFFQRHFTPNNDTFSDTWTIQGIDNTFYTRAELRIFDRYGKFLKLIDLRTEEGWNGRFDGKILPSSDYWYTAILIDITGAVRKKTGHFSLLRR